MVHSRKEIVFLNTARQGDEAEIGPKAFGLVRLIQARMRVPAGFCVTTAAYRRHVDRDDFAQTLRSTLVELEQASQPRRKELLAQLRSRLIELPLDDTLTAEIGRALSSLGCDRVAVRSSASSEDLPDHSAAGQHDSFLGVQGLDDCLEAIRKCWASLWTQRAYEYRRQNGIDHRHAAMAVIVQQQIDADAAGVAFSLDPITGSPSRIVIEACFGLGQALVSGQVEPDRLLVRKKTLTVIRHDVAAKRLKHICNGAGVREVTLDAVQASTPALDLRTVRKLARGVRTIDKKLGGPQDVEWALSDGRLWYLQARPVTATAPARSWQDRQVWSNANFGEVAPDPLTPITWSMIQRFADSLFQSAIKMMCIQARPHHFTGLVAGRLYWNANTGLGALQHLPGWEKIAWADAFGGHGINPAIPAEAPDIPDEDIPDLHGSLLKVLLRLPVSLLDIYRNRQSKARQAVDLIHDVARDLQRLDLSSLSDAQIARAMNNALDELDRLDILCIIPALGMLAVADWLYNRWLANTDAPPLAHLLAGIQGMASAQAGLDLWKLSAKANELPDVRDAILSGSGWQRLKEMLADHEQGRAFFAAYDEFIAEHGHHCRGELELANPRWAERPDYLLGQLQAYLNSAEHTDLSEHYQMLIDRRKDAEAQCLRRLRNPIRRRLFRYALRHAQSGCVLRENAKNAAVILINAARRILLELGRRFFNRGLLERPDDVFFLRLEQLSPVAGGDATPDLRRTIESRRAEYELHCTYSPPSLVIGRFDPARQVDQHFDADATSLSGIGAGAGVVTGKARVILRADDDQQVLAGEVLVAPFTDPGWTPYFVTAAAIVMEQGGQLSHGSIIAREFGLPAVVNVPHATKIIKTGQTLHVDGTKGTVTIG